ncbi:hypothetical protein F5887DRAFT_929913 [Amanita rubescens]|nr:hypothetical protein F5887DRAFT_929913 [Amanita rubescens]
MLWSKDTRFIRWLPCEAKEYKVYKGTQTTLFTVRRGLKWHTHGAHSVVRGKRDPLARRINLVATRIDLKTTFPIQATDIYVLLMKCPKCPQKIVAQNSRMIPRFVPSPPLYIEQPLTSSPDAEKWLSILLLAFFVREFDYVVLNTTDKPVAFPVRPRGFQTYLINQSISLPLND